MRFFDRSKISILVSFLVIAAGAAACGAEAPDAPADTRGATAQALDEDGASTLEWWREQRAARQAAFDAYLAANADDAKSFKNAPLGSSGVPMIMLRLFPEIFPEIWGQPNEWFANVGFAKDDLEPGRVLPLGLGFTGSSPAVPTPAGPVNVNVVNLTCAGCHTGRVETPSGTKSILGAPSTTFRRFRGKVFQTVTSPGYTPEAFRAALASKPLGFVYGDPALVRQEALERAIFMAPGGAESFLAQLKNGSIAGAQRFAQTLGAYTYQTPNSPDPGGETPGFLDAIGAGIALVVDPSTLTPEQVKAAVPPRPAMIDIMSVWNQSGRPVAQWDGSITTKIHRNLAAEFGVVGNPAKLNMDNVVRTTRLTENMPAPPYPFDVPRDAVARGKHLYAQYCASCHAPGQTKIFSTAEIGTDPNRAEIWTPYNMAALRGALRLGCTDGAACNQPDGSPVPDEQLVRSTGGYMAVPLDGVWARAPYLHNGSVPTLRALLVPSERPTHFFRGNAKYDESGVGFASDKVWTPGAAQYDTTKSGNGNGGHATAAFLGDVDWKTESGKLADLLAYLKTL